MSTQHTRRVFQWLDKVALDKELPASAFKVAYVIAQHLNEDSGEAFPGSDRIAARIAMSQATVIDMVRKLSANGHLGVDPGRAGRGHSNRYRMIVKPQPTEVLKPRAAKTVKPQPAELKPQPADMNYFTNHKGSDLRSLSLVERVVTTSLTDVDDAPLSPALAAAYAEAKANPTVLHKVIRDPAVAGRLFQQMLEVSEPIDELPLEDAFLEMGRGPRANGGAGLTIDEHGNVIDEINIATPKARNEGAIYGSYAEAIYGSSA